MWEQLPEESSGNYFLKMYFSEVCVRNISGRYLLEVFLGGRSGRHIEKVYVGAISWGYVCSIFGRYMWEIFLEGRYRSVFQEGMYKSYFSGDIWEVFWGVICRRYFCITSIMFLVFSYQNKGPNLIEAEIIIIICLDF